jgi:hypothetical protein
MYFSADNAGAWANEASYDVPQRGRIEGLCFTQNDDCDADGDTVLVNVTFSSTPGAPANGDLSSIFYHAKINQLVTSGMQQNCTTMYTKLPDIPVAPGQRIFLHLFTTSGVIANGVAALHMSYDTPR